MHDKNLNNLIDKLHKAIDICNELKQEDRENSMNFSDDKKSSDDLPDLTDNSENNIDDENKDKDENKDSDVNADLNLDKPEDPNDLNQIEMGWIDDKKPLKKSNEPDYDLCDKNKNLITAKSFSDYLNDLSNQNDSLAKSMQIYINQTLRNICVRRANEGFNSVKFNMNVLITKVLINFHLSLKEKYQYEDDITKDIENFADSSDLSLVITHKIAKLSWNK